MEGEEKTVNLKKGQKGISKETREIFHSGEGVEKSGPVLQEGLAQPWSGACGQNQTQAHRPGD